MRSNMLQTVLNDLNGTSADIEASAIISSDGLMMAALLPNTVDEDRVGAMRHPARAMQTSSLRRMRLE